MTWETYCDEIRPFWLLVTKGYGFTVKDIDCSCPADLEPYAKAYELEQKQKDEILWIQCGTYFLNAIQVAVEHCLFGKKAKSEYIKNSISKECELREKENSYKENREEIAVFEMKQRINLLEKAGLPQSPL